jgi:YaiO family outer membrane protein
LVVSLPVPSLFITRGSRRGQDRAHTHQVVSGRGESEHPVHARNALVPGLAKQPYRLHPAEYLLDSFPLSDAHLVAVMAGRAPVNGTLSVGVVLGDVRRNIQVAQPSDEFFGVIAFVRSKRQSLVQWADLRNERQSGLAFGRAGSEGHCGTQDQAVAVLHQGMAEKRHLIAVPFGVDAGIRVGCGLVGGVGALLPLEIDAGVLGSGAFRGLSVLGIFGPEALEAGPGFEQGAVNAEVLLAEQVACPRLREHGLEKGGGHVPFQETLAVLAVSRGIPNSLKPAHPHEPAKQHVVTQPLNQLPLRTDCIQYLQQKSAQEPFWRNGRTTVQGVACVEKRRQLRQRAIYHHLDRSQWMVGGHQAFRARREFFEGSLFVKTAHARLLRRDQGILLKTMRSCLHPFLNLQTLFDNSSARLSVFQHPVKTALYAVLRLCWFTVVFAFAFPNLMPEAAWAAPAWQLESGLEGEYLTNGYAPWQALYVSALYTPGRFKDLYASLRETDRFSLLDAEFCGGGAWPMGDRTVISLDGTVSPTARVLPGWSLAGQLSQGILPAWNMLVSLKDTAYTLQNVPMAGLGVENYTGSWRWFAGGNASPALGAPWSFAYQASATDYLRDTDAVTLLVSAGQEIDQVAASRLVRSDVLALSLSGHWEVFPGWLLLPAVTWTHQGAFYDRYTFHGAVRRSF